MPVYNSNTDYCIEFGMLRRAPQQYLLPVLGRRLDRLSLAHSAAPPCMPAPSVARSLMESRGGGSARITSRYASA